MISLSVIIPAFNVEDSIVFSAMSVIPQLNEEDELIIVDDASTDATVACAEKLASKYSCVVVYSQKENKGCAAARKAGVQLAKNDYIMFLDADDAYEADALDKVRGAITKTKADIIHFSIKLINHSQGGDERDKPREKYFLPVKGPLRGDDIFRACYIEGKYAWNLVNKAFKASICKKAFSWVNDEHVQRGEDAYIFFLISYYAKTYFGMREEYLYRYNFGLGQDTSGHVSLENFSSFLDSADAYNAIQAFLTKVPDTPLLRNGALHCGITLASNCAFRLHRALSPGDQRRGFAMFAEAWDMSIVAAALRKEYAQKENELFSVIDANDLHNPREDMSYIATYYHKLSGGGVEGVLGNLLRLWHRMGYKVLLFLDEEPTSEQLSTAQIDSYCVLPALTSSPESCFRREEVFAHALTVFPVHMLVYHAWVDKALPWDLMTCKANGVRVVVHCHGIFSHYTLTSDPYFSSMPAIYSQLDGIVSLSQVDASYWGMFNSNVHVTINPTDINLDDYPFVDASCHKGHDLLWLARVAPEKGPIETIEAFKHVVHKIPDATLTMVGSASSRWCENKVNRALELSPVRDRITCVPWTDDQANYYRSARVFVMASEEREGYPLTLAESKSFGLPCVMFDLPYLTLVQDGRGIITVPQGDTVELAHQIVRVLTDDALCSRLSHEARQSIEDLRDFDYQDLWEAVFADARAEKSHAKTPPVIWTTLLASYAKGARSRNAAEQWRKNNDAAQISKLKKRINKYKESNSWRIGRAITFLPRLAKRVAKRIRRGKDAARKANRRQIEYHD